MKRLTTVLLLLLFAGIVACNPVKSVTTRDAVKTLQTTTADYFEFVNEGRRGTLKDASYFIVPNLARNPDLRIKIIKGAGKDEGFWIPAPAQAGTATTLAPSDNPIEEIELRIGDLSPSVFPQRGN
jgi:hypothetical protein